MEILNYEERHAIVLFPFSPSYKGVKLSRRYKCTIQIVDGKAIIVKTPKKKKTL